MYPKICWTWFIGFKVNVVLLVSKTRDVFVVLEWLGARRCDTREMVMMSVCPALCAYMILKLFPAPRKLINRSDQLVVAAGMGNSPGNNFRVGNVVVDWLWPSCSFYGLLSFCHEGRWARCSVIQLLVEKTSCCMIRLQHVRAYKQVSPDHSIYQWSYHGWKGLFLSGHHTNLTLKEGVEVHLIWVLIYFVGCYPDCPSLGGNHRNFCL